MYAYNQLYNNNINYLGDQSQKMIRSSSLPLFYPKLDNISNNRYRDYQNKLTNPYIFNYDNKNQDFILPKVNQQQKIIQPLQPYYYYQKPINHSNYFNHSYIPSNQVLNYYNDKRLKDLMIKKKKKPKKRRKHKRDYDNESESVSFSLSSDSDCDKIVSLSRKLREEIKYAPLKKKMQHYMKKINRKLKNKFENEKLLIDENIDNFENSYNISKRYLEEKIKNLELSQKKTNNDIKKAIDNYINEGIKKIQKENDKKLKSKIDEIIQNEIKNTFHNEKDNYSKNSSNYYINNRKRLQEIISEEVNKMLSQNNSEYYKTISKKKNISNSKINEINQLNLKNTQKSLISKRLNKLNKDLKGNTFEFYSNKDSEKTKNLKKNKEFENKDDEKENNQNEYERLKEFEKENIQNEYEGFENKDNEIENNQNEYEGFENKDNEIENNQNQNSNKEFIENQLYQNNNN